MAKHEFGIMEKEPIIGKRYDKYEPEKYHCISVDDEQIEAIAPKLCCMDCFSHTLDIQIKGLEYCGITLIPPQAAAQFICLIGDNQSLLPLKALLQQAITKNKYVIHYGL
ncbi:MAG: hypothetical protein LUC38_09820 [Oscillospiraceae bacterium]|nr:hypothetical protein [Ruminococcus sp.]MCD8346226.1 hypothetical protein [Oscillospiraceae bacterium]